MDRHTLYSFEGGLLLFMAIVLYCMFLRQRRHRHDRSADWAAAAFTFGGVGMLLQSYRGMGPDFLTILLGNGIFILFGACMARAIAKATSTTRDYFGLLLALDAAVILNFSYYTFVKPDVVLRTAEATLVMCVQYATILSILRANKDTVIRPAVRLIVLFYSLHIGMNVIRVSAVLRTHQADAWSTWFGVVTITGFGLSFLYIEPLRMMHELESRAITDPLTELLNRRGLEQIAAREQSLAGRREYACSALSLDINHFKKINDSWGHAAGDQALCAVAATLRATLRTSDIAARLGGDEFFVLLPDCEEHAAQEAALRFRTAVEQLELTTFYGERFHISISIGVASGKGKHVSLPDLMHASDILLYQDKKNRHGAEGAVAGVISNQVHPLSAFVPRGMGVS